MDPEQFELLTPIRDQETIAVRFSIRQLAALQALYGRARWRKRKGVANVMLRDGSVHLAELHWYEAHGVGRRQLRIKRLFE